MIERNKLGMLMFVMSEAVFFFLLLAAYAFYHRQDMQGPTAANSLDTLKSGIFSLALFASSGTLWLAERSHRRHDRRLVAVWLFATLALGAVFLAGQGLEYWHLLENNVTISRNLFGTTFFTLTGFHGFHVLIGLLLLAILLAVSTLGRKGEPAAPAMTCVAIYWHFVDVVWIFIFAVVYLWKFI
jgi:heme/copper-type cytochrome/quinol oxidase subunit 3